MSDSLSKKTISQYCNLALQALPLFYLFFCGPSLPLFLTSTYNYFLHTYLPPLGINEDITNKYPPIEPKITDFPPTEPHTYRVVITACKNEKNIPQFDPARTTFTNCNVLSDCNEAPSYLDFLYNWYDNLTEEVVIFTHGHLKSWHITNVEDAVNNAVQTEYFWTQPFGGFKEGRWKQACDNVQYQELYSYFYFNTTMPRKWLRYSIYPCCSTFFVRTEQIRRRPKVDYLNILNNLREWMKINKGQAFYCGRLFEYTWHILFTGKNKIPLPGEVDYAFKREGDQCPFRRSDIM